MKAYPSFVSLDLQYDPEPLLAEALGYEHALGGGGIMRYPIEHRHDPNFWLVAPDDYYDHVTHMDKGVIVHGKYPSWEVLNLRHVPDHPGSFYGGNRFRTSEFNSRWEWSSDLPAPEIRRVVEQLPYRKLGICRIMVIKPGGFGPVHQDLADDKVYESGVGSITLTLTDGGQPIQVRMNQVIHEINGGCFYFKDSCFHGIGVTTSRRVVIRTHGVIDVDRFLTMAKPETALWGD